MILYHGSYLTIEKPDLSFSRNTVDFGKGFYVTPFKEQAAKWAARFKDTKGDSVISAYEFDDSIISELRILEFDTYSEGWLDFIVNCRKGNPALGEYDIIAGSVANDKVFDTIEEYVQGYRTKKQALGRLRYEKPNWQYCFKKQEIIDEFLHFIESEAAK